MLNLAAGSLRFVKRPTPDPRDATIKKPPDWAWFRVLGFRGFRNVALEPQSLCCAA